MQDQNFELSRHIYGFRDNDTLGPVNFTTIADLFQLIIYAPEKDSRGQEIRIVKFIAEVDIKKHGEKKARRIINNVIRDHGGDPKKLKVKTAYCGPRYR